MRRVFYIAIVFGLIYTDLLGFAIALGAIDFCVNGKWGTIQKSTRAKYTAIFIVSVVLLIDKLIPGLLVSFDVRHFGDEMQQDLIPWALALFTCLVTIVVIRGIRRSANEKNHGKRSNMWLIWDTSVVCLCVTGLAVYLQVRDATNRPTNMTRYYTAHIGSWSGCVPTEVVIQRAPPSMISRRCLLSQPPMLR